jgi:hypothetical protein
MPHQCPCCSWTLGSALCQHRSCRKHASPLASPYNVESTHSHMHE